MKRIIISSLLVLALTLSAFSSTAFADYYSGKVTLYYGMNNSEVKNLQNDLKKLGYFYANSTGYFGSITKQSVIQYQKANGLVADGIVGKLTSSEIKADRVVQTAKQLNGAPYAWGGASPSGFDCSGFTHYVFLQNGINIPRTAELQYSTGQWVSRSNLKPGDLVFFTTYKSGPSHVGIYIGNNQFINASSGSGKIVITSLDNPYFAPRYIGAKRII